ncbi:MAG TPA: rhomboid family intramembrane serine protease, partial [Ilumatobacteraceae bacterium]|nr:rhomboid family intramembrane serine protease [Ilumatobacteraceae bacterium]
GDATAERLLRTVPRGPQPLSLDQQRQVDEMLAELERTLAVFGQDRGAWRPLATWGLALMLLAAFCYQLGSGGFDDAALVHQGAFLAGTLDGAWWRAATASVLHANATHLLFNLLGLLLIGRIAEARVPRWTYLTTWFAASIGGFVAYWVIPPKGALMGVGASGGVMGLLGLALAVFVVNHRDRRSSLNSRELRQLVLITVLQLFVDQVVPNIAALGHFAGLLIGFTIGLGVYGSRSAPGKPAPTT